MTALDPLDRDLLDFLCAVEANPHCRVTSVKVQLRPSLRRLRYAGLVCFDGFTPSGSAMADWTARKFPPSPPPGGAAGEEPPTPTAASTQGGAAARKRAAPPKADARPTGKELYATLMAEADKRGLTQTDVSNQAFGNQVQMSNMKHCERCVWERTLTKAQAWLESDQRNTDGARGTARKAPTAEESTSAEPETSGGSDTVGAPPEEPSSQPEAAGAQLFRCGHPKTPNNIVGKSDGRKNGVCRTCRNKRQIDAYHAKKERDRPFEVEPAHFAEAGRQERTNARRTAAIKRGIEQQALRLVDGDDSVRSVGGQVSPVVKVAANAIIERRKAEARQTDPIERAKLVLQRRYAPVCSMAVYGGESGLFMVGNKQNVTQAELLQMAGRIAA